MTDNKTSPLDRIGSDESRRSFLKKSAITATTGVAATGTVTAHEDGEDDSRFRVAVFEEDFRNKAVFLIVSGPIDHPSDIAADVGDDRIGYDTYRAMYPDTDEQFLLFISHPANLQASYGEDAGVFVTDQEIDGASFNTPALYQLANPYSRYEGTDRLIMAYAFSISEDVQRQVND